VIWGDADTITTRIGQQLRAGADHVILHALSEAGQADPIDMARSLAG